MINPNLLPMLQPSKCPWTASTYHIDQLGDVESDNVSYKDIAVRKGCLNKTGCEPLPIRMSLNDHLSSASTWMNLSAWSLVDDTDLALDPRDGMMYEQAVDQDVMEDVEATGEANETHVGGRKQYNRSKVLVSLLRNRYS